MIGPVIPARTHQNEKRHEQAYRFRLDRGDSRTVFEFRLKAQTYGIAKSCRRGVNIGPAPQSGFSSNTSEHTKIFARAEWAMRKRAGRVMTEHHKPTHRPWMTVFSVLLFAVLIIVATRQADAQSGECATGEGAVVYAGSGTSGDTFAIDLSDGSSQLVANLNAEVGNHMSANSDALGGEAGAQLYFDWDDGGSSREHGRYEPPKGLGPGAGDGNTAGSFFVDMSNIYFNGAPGHGYMDIEGAGATARNRFIISAPEAQWFCFYGCNGGAQAPNNATEEFFLIKLDETGEALSDGTTTPTLGTTVFDLNYRNASGFPSLSDDLSGLGDILVVDDDSDSDPRTLLLYGSTTGTGSIDGFWRFDLFADTTTDTYTLSNFVVINASSAASGNQLAADGNNNVFWAPGDDSAEIQQVHVSTGTGTPLWSTVTGDGITDLTSAANCGTQLDFGDAPASYEATGSGDSPAAHTVTENLYLGTVAPDVDINSATLLSATADRQVDGDDRIGFPYDSAIDDEDGVSFPTPPTGAWQEGDQFVITATTHNSTGMDALLCGWIDFDDDGSFENDADERVCETVTDATTSVQLSFTIPADFVSDGGNDATYYSRFRLTTAWSGAADATPLGRVADGEVEDHPIDLSVLPVSLNAFESALSDDGLVIKWQTASETNNVGFELWGRSHGRWRVLGDFIASQGMNSALPQTYEESVPGGSEIRALALVDYDTRGRPEGFGPFEPGEDYGELQPAERIDWEGPRLRRKTRLLARGFVNTTERRIEGRMERSTKRRHTSSKRFSRRGAQRSSALGGFSHRERWRRLIRQRSNRIKRPQAPDAEPVIVDGGAASGNPEEGSESGAPGTVLLHASALTHVEVTKAGIQRVSYAALNSAGLDLTGVRHDAIAVTWRGEPVARWIGGGDERFGPGHWIEFIGHPPKGDDALYIDANLYQVAVNPDKVRRSETIAAGSAGNASESFQASVTVDRPLLHHPQSATGDPWVERVELVRGRKQVTLDIVVEGPVAPGPASLFVNLGSITDLPDKTGSGGEVLPEHNVEVWLKKPGDSGFTRITTSSVSGQHDWEIAAPLPAGVPEPGTYKVQLRFSTAYHYSLVAVDRYGLRYAAPYRGAALDFAPDPAADGYRITGLGRSSIAAYGEGVEGALVRLEPAVERVESGYVAELPQVNAARVWVSQTPHEPQVFTTEASGDLLAEPGDLVVVAESSFIGTPALEDYVQSKAAFNPVVVDVEDIYNAVGYGMAVPRSITDYLKARDARHPFTHVQLVGTDCYDRMNYISDCMSFIPLPTARVGVTLYSPSQNRLVDLDGDGVGDKAVGQFSVRDESELAIVVDKGSHWRNSVAGLRSALLVAEGSDGKHDFMAQIERLRDRVDWSRTEVLDLGEHTGMEAARRAFETALETG